jgi:putative ATP-dependent endonuclease of OLD family
LLPSRRHGNGLISLQTLVLLMRFGHLRKANGENFLMAIEEPELHIPPPPQRSLLHFMRQLATQTIITTHSPIVAAVPNPNQLILLVNNGGELSARPLLSEPLDPEATNVRRALFLTDRDATVTAVMHPSILVPEGKTDASWLRLLSRIASLTESDQDLGVPSFNHNVGVIPTKDARVMDTYLELAGVHPMISCLVDGDDAGRGYLDQLTAANPPCPRVVVWPEDWSIEHVIAWLISADPTVLDDDELTEIGIPQDIGGLPAFLLANPHKTDVVIHALIADAIAANQSCVARVWHLLSVIASIATQSDVPADAAFSRLHENQVTTVWTFNDAFPGI